MITRSVMNNGRIDKNAYTDHDDNMKATYDDETKTTQTMQTMLKLMLG